MVANADAFHVDRWTHWLGGFVTRRRRLWTRLGNLETRLLKDDIAELAIDRPIYVGGLARSGSTVLLETLARHREVATHQYRDYPLLFTPWWWNRFLQRAAKRKTEAVERSHQDGIMVTPESPEALEEMLWMAFFPNLHDPTTSNVLDGDTHHPEFETFYRDHLRKLLRARGGSRYVAKGNYNTTRFEYLLSLFPDARFVLPIRSPAGHIASLMKQHGLLSEGEREYPKALEYMRRVGHFEFGLDRRPVHAGDEVGITAIRDAWARGGEVEGWARYWSHIHGYIADRLEANERLRAATLVVRFEDLCESPRDVLTGLFEHCQLSGAEALIENAATGIRFPTYYRPRFTDDERALIQSETQTTAARFGY